MTSLKLPSYSDASFSLLQIRSLKVVDRVALLAAVFLIAHNIARAVSWTFLGDATPYQIVMELSRQAIFAALFIATIWTWRISYRFKIYAFFAIAIAAICFYTIEHRAGEPHLFLFAAPAVAVSFFGTQNRAEPILISVFSYLIATHIMIVSSWQTGAQDFTAAQLINRTHDFWTTLSFSDVTWLLVICTTGTTIFVATFVAHDQVERAEEALARENARSELLLSSLLPPTIARRLKQNPDAEVAEEYSDVSILFADIVGFSSYASTRPATEVVKRLNRLFSAFDALAEKHGLEKIKTVGDSYMVASGLPEIREDHATALADMAIDMIAAVERISLENKEDITLRIGIHRGPAVAGVIGHNKPFYDVWGDTINVASRMQTTAEPGRIQITPELKEALNGPYRFEPRGVLDIKGIGRREAFYLSSA